MSRDEADALAVLDRLIDETRAVSNKIPFVDSRFGASMGIGYRLQVLGEARAAIVKARLKQMERAA